ncbi:CAP domain-containing protein [Mesobacillus maritimus]|uniref:CAP domain-containing protein n=1 Tax=Mesobacillus maritimus TaxID=1643336 RepID=UPI00384E0F56
MHLRFIFLFLIGFMLYNFWPDVEEKLGIALIDSIRTEFNDLKKNTDLSTLPNNLEEDINSLVNRSFDEEENQVENEQTVDVPVLDAPVRQTFSIANIELGETKTKVEEVLGAPSRSSVNEYGTEWYAYHQNYHNFIMISYNENNKVVGIYTNQDLISSTTSITHGTPKDQVLQQLGKPVEKIQKGMVFYQLQKERDYDLFQIDNSYVSIFYDKHENNVVTAIQIISESMEQQRIDFYSEASEALKEGFEYQLFDLTNATRVERGLSALQWDEQVKETARKHSSDMAENNYFSHTNLVGESPFDRMSNDDILFSVAGENLAYGQTSSVFAHEGLMNSLGHRENILKAEFKQLGVGVAFNSDSHPYYTQKYYTKR